MNRLFSGYADVSVRAVRRRGKQTISALSIDRGVYVVADGYGAHNTGWEYKRVLEGYGVQQTKSEHYSQLQLYMHGVGAKWGLYAATPMDPRLLEKIMRQRRKYGTGFQLRWTYLEWIAYDEEYVDTLLQRAKILVNDTNNDTPPPREDTGVTVSIIGKQRWPCGYCAFLKSCVDLYGISDYG
jgi:hypothetical protein